MTFQELLNSRSHDYDCYIIIGDVEMNADIVPGSLSTANVLLLNAASATARIAFTVKLSAVC